MANKVSNIFEGYFDLIDSYFGSIKSHLSEDKYAHEQLGREMSSYPFVSDLILDATDSIGEEIFKFWKQNHKDLSTYLTGSKGLKCLYSGDLSPVDIESFVKKSGLYVDTIIIPDPLLNIATFFKPAFSDKKLYLNKLIRHVFNVMKLRELMLADTKEKIVLLYPSNIQTLGSDIQNKIFSETENKYLDYFIKLFGRQFSSRDEVLEFLRNFKDEQDLFKIIKDTSLLPQTINSPSSFKSKMGEMFSLDRRFNIPQYKNLNEAFGVYVYTQFLRVQEHKYYCKSLTAEPIYDYELPWSFLNYDLGGQDIDPAILNALQKKDFEWIGNVPFEALKVLREENQMEYMRSTLRRGITSMQSKSDKDLSKTVEQLQENIGEAFKRQKSEVKALKDKVGSILKKDIPIEIGAYLVGFIPIYGNFLTLPSVAKSIYEKYMTHREAKKKLDKEEKGTINLLLKSYDKKS